MAIVEKKLHSHHNHFHLLHRNNSMTPHQAAQAAHAGALHAGGGHADGAGGGGHDDSGAHGPPTLRALNLRQAAADDKSKGGGHSHGRAGGALRAVASGAKVATRTLSFGKSKKKKAAEEGGGGAREAPARLQNGEFG